MKYYLTGNFPPAITQQLCKHIACSLDKRFGKPPLFLLDPTSFVAQCLIKHRPHGVRWITIDPVHPPAIAEAVVIDDSSSGMHRHYAKVKHLNCLYHVYKLRTDDPTDGFCKECFQLGHIEIASGMGCYCKNCHCVYV
jgi:hypothetical protein